MTIIDERNVPVALAATRTTERYQADFDGRPVNGTDPADEQLTNSSGTGRLRPTTVTPLHLLFLLVKRPWGAAATRMSCSVTI
ncbi:hypothetical protein ACQUSR_06380 [Streptomyces sp. P1-3]|uniref:hypothetical protein n=1 Tax=Streptomyces sp. P1-3 TaxID=3421658 RepID=UPI003D362F01